MTSACTRPVQEPGLSLTCRSIGTKTRPMAYTRLGLFVAGQFHGDDSHPDTLALQRGQIKLAVRALLRASRAI